jgi:hypothetical protein
MLIHLPIMRAKDSHERRKDRGPSGWRSRNVKKTQTFFVFCCFRDQDAMYHLYVRDCSSRWYRTNSIDLQLTESLILRIDDSTMQIQDGFARPKVTIDWSKFKLLQDAHIQKKEQALSGRH